MTRPRRDLPFGRYYGTADASALYVLLMHDHWKAIGRRDLVVELSAAWRGAIAWCRRARGDDGLLRYSTESGGRGLVNNSWKDSVSEGQVTGAGQFAVPDLVRDLSRRFERPVIVPGPLVCRENAQRAFRDPGRGGQQKP